MKTNILTTFGALAYAVSALCQSCPSSASLHPEVIEGITGMGWASGANVPVYIVSNTTSGVFSAASVTSIETDLGTWNNSVGSNISWQPSVVSTLPDPISPPYIAVQYGTASNCSEPWVMCTA